MRKIQNIIILAAGDCTRFWPLKNKSFLPFLGKPLVSYVVKTLSDFGEKITIVINSENKENDYLKKSELNIIFQDKDKEGMAGAVLSCQDKIVGDVLIVNAEDIIDFAQVADLIDKSRHEKLDLAFLAKKMLSYFPGGYLRFENQKLAEIVEKPDPKHIPSDLGKLVFDYFSDINLFINRLKEIKLDKDDLYEQAINEIIKSKKVGFIEYDGYWQTLKYPWHVLTMKNHFLSQLKSHRGKNVEIDSSAKLKGEVYMEDGVKILNSALVIGPAFLGKNTVVGSYAMVNNSLIEDKVVVGGYSEVTRSYLGNGIMLHRNYIGDSVLDKNVFFGAGAVTANFRFDGKNPKSAISGVKIDTQLPKLGAIVGENSKIGVNASILPGVKIGRNSFVGPGEIIKEDVKDNTFIFK